MNRLFSKLKDFGLIFSLPVEEEKNIITASRALKKADLPVALFSFDALPRINAIKISNENEDMFLGALCPDNFEIMKSAMASGAHFIISRAINRETIKRCRIDGYDLIVSVTSDEEINLAVESNAGAIVINCNNRESEKLLHSAVRSGIPLFLSGKMANLPVEKMRNYHQFCAFIIEDSFKRVNEIINRLLGLRYSVLNIREDSPRSREAAIFCALSSIPLTIGGKRDLLTITVGDMDRAIAHFKWKEIYMDPLSAKMKDSIILETELYTEFFGWTVKLINREEVFLQT